VDGRDESSAYLEFLNEEVRILHRTSSRVCTNSIQAQKFKNLEDNDSDDELGEESLLDTPLDKVEPYQLFKNALLSKFSFCPSYYNHTNNTQSSNKNSLNSTSLLPRILTPRNRILFRV